ncbi:MAG: hypothetical protein ACRDJP_01685 [Actinomycetota bacterium]
MEITQVNPWKTRNQLRRAHKLIDAIDNLRPDIDDAVRLRFAETLSPAKWADVALVAGITEPSVTTVALAIGILDTRVTNNQMAAAGADVFAGWSTH